MNEFRMRQKAGIKLNPPTTYCRGKVRNKKKDIVYSFQSVRASGFRTDPYYSLDGFEVIPETFTVWTGKYDKNMKAVFAGDFVKFNYDVHDCDGKTRTGEIVYLVHWNDDLGGYALGGEEGEDCGGMEDVPEFEVVGNVFDNPDLAEKFYTVWIERKKAEK